MSDPTRAFLGPRGFPQADHLLAPWHRWLAGAAALFLVAASVRFGFVPTLMAVNIVVTVLFFLSTLYRFLLVDLSLHSHEQIELRPAELQPPPGGWPRYTIQVPLYHEQHAVPYLVHALAKLDYPTDRLSVQLLVEDDDHETRAAIAATALPAHFEQVCVPVSQPRTKPKACNVGLAAARGDYLVIYDAEDRPEPDQLKKAVVAFTRCPPEVVCIQAKLNFYNPWQNLLTRCFTAEYAMWFDLCLPGLDRLHAPIPLGGTSNHFRLSVLRQLGGWDEYNVTEDCDLGLRLFTAGWRTRILDSTTWEEACPSWSGWFRQRSRWFKGYVQTYLVHTRDLGGLTHRLGLRNSLHFHLLIGGSIFSQLLSPVYWALVVVWLVLQSGLRDGAVAIGWHFAPGLMRTWQVGEWLDPAHLSVFFPGPVFALAALCLFVGNFAFVYSCVIACILRDRGRIARFTPVMVLYWIAMSFAAWKGALQLITRPHYWEKTTHNVS